MNPPGSFQSNKKGCSPFSFSFHSLSPHFTRSVEGKGPLRGLPLLLHSFHYPPIKIYSNPKAEASAFGYGYPFNPNPKAEASAFGG